MKLASTISGLKQQLNGCADLSAARMGKTWEGCTHGLQLNLGLIKFSIWDKTHVVEKEPGLFSIPSIDFGVTDDGITVVKAADCYSEVEVQRALLAVKEAVSGHRHLPFSGEAKILPQWYYLPVVVLLHGRNLR